MKLLACDIIEKIFQEAIGVASGTCGENVRWLLSSDTLIIFGTGEMENYIYGKQTPWENYKKIIRVGIIGFGITAIGDRAFSDCPGLTSVKISTSVVTIGSWAFYWCKNLKNVTIPESVKTIGDFAFAGCNSLKNMTIPDTVKIIGYEVFSACYGLWEIHYPASRNFERILSQGNYALIIPYEKLRWKVEGKTLTVGGVREIKDYSREQLSWIDSFGNIQKKAPWFKNFRDIQEIVIAAGVEKISANAFSECTRLELLTIPASVKTIGDFAFTFCYCGNRSVNGGKNVVWSLDDGVLTFKKNPAAKFATDFSIGVVSWCAVEKNITGFKLEVGVVPKEKFFEWLAQRDNAAQISFA